MQTKDHPSTAGKGMRPNSSMTSIANMSARLPIIICRRACAPRPRSSSVTASRSKHPEFGRVSRRLVGVVQGRGAEHLPFLVGELANHACRCADDQAAATKLFTLGHQRAGTDDAFGPDFRAVQDPRAHAD